jgi:hypothetical protein
MSVFNFTFSISPFLCQAWKRGNIQFLKMFPDSQEALDIASKMASQVIKAL